MFKRFIAICLVSTVSFSSVIAGAKDDKYDKLKALYEEGKYEDCAFKAESFSLKEDMRKDAEPYLYLSMSLYQLSMLSTMEIDYPKAFEDAFKYAAKAVKYDEEGEVYKENKAYFDELKEAGVKEATGYFSSGNYSKSAKYLDKILKFNPEDDYIRLTKGICDILSRNTGEGGMELKLSFVNINKGLYKLNDTPESSQKLLSTAFIKYSEYLNSSNMKDSSKTTIKIAKGILPDDAYLKTL